MSPTVPSKRATQDLGDAYKRTTERLGRIQSHFSNATGSGRLKGKVCVITGVASLKGIGRAAAIAFAREGARHLYLLDFNGDSLPDLGKSLNEAYPAVKVTTIQADAANEEAIKTLCERIIEEEGRLDVFFANAGIVVVNTLLSATASGFMDVMRVNALSCFLALKYASEAMKVLNPKSGKTESSGSIIMTASVAGIRSGAGPVDYSASKAAVNSMVYTGSFQLAGTNIRANSICPGLIETGMTDLTFEASRKRGTAGRIGQLNPLQRYGIAPEIAQVALFLASDESSYINGQLIAVDGGLSASLPVVPGKQA